MNICEYCGRILKNHYDVCPGCGSTSFKPIAFLGEQVIETPPKNGYILKTKNYEKSKKIAGIFKWVGIAIIASSILFMLPFLIVGIFTMNEDPTFGISFILIPIISESIFIIMGIGFIIGGKKYQQKAKMNIERVQKLAKTGTLIKNMPYELTESGTVINGKPIYCIKVIYKNSKGVDIPLISEAKYDNKLGNKNGTADLLIDPNDYSNYYIDFEIY